MASLVYIDKFVHPYPTVTRVNVRGKVFLILLLVGIFLVGCTGTSGAQQTLAGHLLVVGSTALQPLVTKAAALFQKQHPQVNIVVKGGGSISGLQSVTGSKSDIGDSDIYADPAIYPDPNLTDHIVCVVPFTMIMSPGINVTSLSQQEIINIFSTGTISNWRQVGGPDLAIVPVVRPPTSGTRATFRKYILGGRDENSAHGRLLTTDTSTAVRDTVAHTPGAIGYLALSVLNKSVQPLAIDGYTPTLSNIETGHYAFWSYEHMYTLGDNNVLASAFLDFMLTATIQQTAHDMGYIPIANMKLGTTLSATPQIGSILTNHESEVI